MPKYPDAGGWSEEMDKVLQEAVAAGQTASQAAMTLGSGKTKSACIARARRLGLRFEKKIQVGSTFRVATPEDLAKPKRSPKPAIERKGGSTARYQAQKGFNPIAFAPHTQEAAKTAAERRRQAQETREEMLGRMAEMARVRPGVPFMERKTMQCVAMFGTGMHANCCGEPVTARPDGLLSSYCAEHHRLYHTYTPKVLTKLDFTDAAVMKVKLKKPASEEAEAEEELEPVDRLIADEDDDQQQAA